jgi:hypothetical protein
MQIHIKMFESHVLVNDQVRVFWHLPLAFQRRIAVFKKESLLIGVERDRPKGYQISLA